MRKYLCILLLIMFGLQGSVNAQTGINFYEGDWKSLLNEAGRQHKLIFVDVYTDWCAPCKLMEKEVFSLKEAGEVYNAAFINYRLNAERGEGIKLAADYAVKAYPTYLFLDSAGNLVFRSGDYLPVQDFIEVGNAAAAKNKEHGLAQMEDRFKRGDRQPDFLKAFIQKRSSLGMNNAEILNAYIAALPEKEAGSANSLLFLTKHIGSTLSNALPVILNNFDMLGSSDKKQVSDQLYDGLLYYALATAIKENRLTDAADLLADVEKIRPFLSARNLPSADNLALHYYQAAKDKDGVKRTGYLMAAKQMALPVDSISKKDKLLFEQAMQQFLTGKADSTKIPNFQEEKKMAAKQYSANIATSLYTVSTAFKIVLDPKDKALYDAVKWMGFACSIYPNQNLEILRAELEAITGTAEVRK
ncbi:MAG: thioredoxin family protein [Sphingobacteriales bacterium]|nr:MAG: thioredoxin family protein [Sphingobacteriales bacterium]